MAPLCQDVNIKEGKSKNTAVKLPADNITTTSVNISTATPALLLGKKTSPETLTKTPAKSFTKTPAKTPAKTSNKTPSKTPAPKAASRSSKRASGEVKYAENSDGEEEEAVPAKKRKVVHKTPAKTSNKTPSKTPAKTSNKSPSKTSAKISNKTPSKNPAKTRARKTSPPAKKPAAKQSRRSSKRVGGEVAYAETATDEEEEQAVPAKKRNTRLPAPGRAAPAPKRRSHKKSLGSEFDVEEVEYSPRLTARGEAKDKSARELAERRAGLEEEAGKKAAAKEMAVKKTRPEARTDWEVVRVKGVKKAEDTTWYQVMWSSWSRATWEPEGNLTGCQELIEVFLEEQKTRRWRKEERKRREEEGRYEVGRVLDVDVKESGSREFLIRWVGHGAGGDTWEPEDNLDCGEIIEKFMKKKEAAAGVEERSLRTAPKRVDRLHLGYAQRFPTKKKNTPSRREGIRIKDGFRKSYKDMDLDYTSRSHVQKRKAPSFKRQIGH